MCSYISILSVTLIGGEVGFQAAQRIKEKGVRRVMVPLLAVHLDLG
jgi:hypothetical protein